MERKELINEIINFYMKFNLSNRPIKTSDIENLLKDCAYIESLINTILIKTRNYKKLDVEKIINLLNSLDRVRLELEYNEKGSVYNDR